MKVNFSFDTPSARSYKPRPRHGGLMADKRSSEAGEQGEEEKRAESSESSGPRARAKGLWQGIESFIKTLPLKNLPLTNLPITNLPLSEVGDALSRKSREGRIRLDIFLLRREREQLLKDLGAQVLDEVQSNRLTLPAALKVVAEQVREVEERLQEELINLANAQAQDPSKRSSAADEDWDEEEVWRQLQEDSEPESSASDESEEPEGSKD